MIAPSELLFLDTNVLVYAHDTHAGRKHEIARELLGDLWSSGQGCLSIQILQEFYVTVTKKIPAPLSTEEALKIISFLSTWRVHSPTTQDVIGAIDLQHRYQTSFWDALVLHSASKLKCSTVYSEDLNAGQMYYGVQVINPFAEPI